MVTAGAWVGWHEHPSRHLCSVFLVSCSFPIWKLTHRLLFPLYDKCTRVHNPCFLCMNKKKCNLAPITCPSGIRKKKKELYVYQPYPWWNGRWTHLVWCQREVCNSWWHGHNGVNPITTCLVWWAMTQPLMSALLSIFQPVKFPAQFRRSQALAAVSGWNSNFPFQMHIYDCCDPDPFSTKIGKKLFAFQHMTFHFLLVIPLPEIEAINHWWFLQ